MIYRHGSLVIVYMLRKRRYSDGFFDPKSPTATSIKSDFDRVLKYNKHGSLQKIDGFVNLEKVTKTLIDYINREGRGWLSELTF